MSEPTVENKLRDIIVEQLGVEPEQVTTDSLFQDDLGTDSLDEIELVMAVEEEFGIEILDGEVDHIKTFGDAVTYLQKRLGMDNDGS
jgi:acyl carrier protein